MLRSDTLLGFNGFILVINLRSRDGPGLVTQELVSLTPGACIHGTKPEDTNKRTLQGLMHNICISPSPFPAWPCLSFLRRARTQCSSRKQKQWSRLRPMMEVSGMVRHTRWRPSSIPDTWGGDPAPFQTRAWWRPSSIPEASCSRRTMCPKRVDEKLSHYVKRSLSQIIPRCLMQDPVAANVGGEHRGAWVLVCLCAQGKCWRRIHPKPFGLGAVCWFQG